MKLRYISKLMGMKLMGMLHIVYENGKIHINNYSYFGGIVVVLDQWCFRGSHSWYDNKLRLLATNQLPPEKWSYSGRNDYGILRSYLSYTFEKLISEKDATSIDKQNEHIYEDSSQACFNTGLFDKNWQPIYFYCKLNNRSDMQKWLFSEFYNTYTIKYTDIPANAVSVLRRPNYFDDSSLLNYNANFPIVPQWDHILFDHENFERIPEFIRSNGADFCQNLISGAIEKAKKRVDANYHTAVPQWYRGNIQLLVPLYLTNGETPDLALVLALSDDKTQYWGHTCLTLEMAYNNARLITRPESSWLNP
jgi:hypothetical protein